MFSKGRKWFDKLFNVKYLPVFHHFKGIYQFLKLIIFWVKIVANVPLSTLSVSVDYCISVDINFEMVQLNTGTLIFFIQIMIDWLIDWLINRSIDWLIDWCPASSISDIFRIRTSSIICKHYIGMRKEMGKSGQQLLTATEKVQTDG